MYSFNSYLYTPCFTRILWWKQIIISTKVPFKSLKNIRCFFFHTSLANSYADCIDLSLQFNKREHCIWWYYKISCTNLINYCNKIALKILFDLSPNGTRTIDLKAGVSTNEKFMKKKLCVELKLIFLAIHLFQHILKKY